MLQIPEYMKTEFQKAKAAMLQAQRIVIVSHRSPDGDAVGANLALRFALEDMGKEVVSACVDEVPDYCKFLPKSDTYVDDFNYDDFDAIIAVDCGALHLFRFHETKPEILSGEKPFINIDHHESNENFGTINMVNPDGCATGCVLYHFFDYCGWKISIDMANALLTGIYFDTGNLMHSNATAEVFMMCGDLMAKGARVHKISKELFHTTPVNKLRLWGRILERAYINDEGVTVSAVDWNDYAATDTTPQDTGGVIDYLNAVPDSKYCVLLSEDHDKRVKGSLRTQRNDINLSDIASQWGGGGHPKASGFGMEGVLKPVLSWKIVSDEGGEEHAREVKF